MTAATVVPLDQLIASGTSYWGRPPVPYVPGDQGVGVVERSAVLPEGTRVFVATKAGTGAEGRQPGRALRGPRRRRRPAARRRARFAGRGPRHVGRGGVDGAHRAGAAAAGGARARARRRRDRRPGGRRPARLLGAGRVVGVCRSEAAAAARDGRGRRRGGSRSPTTSTRSPTGCGTRVGGAADVVVDTIFGVAATAASRVLGAVRPAGEHRRAVRRHRRVLLRRPAQPHRVRARLHQRAAHRRPAAGGARRRPRARGGRPAGRGPRGAPARRRGDRLARARPPARRACAWC